MCSNGALCKVAVGIMFRLIIVLLLVAPVFGGVMPADSRIVEEGNDYTPVQESRFLERIEHFVRVTREHENESFEVCCAVSGRAVELISIASRHISEHRPETFDPTRYAFAVAYLDGKAFVSAVPFSSGDVRSRAVEGEFTIVVDMSNNEVEQFY